MSTDAEAWVADGELYAPDMAGLCKVLNVLYLYMYEGLPYAGMAGRGAVPLDDLLAEHGKPKLASIKPAPRRTD